MKSDNLRALFRLAWQRAKATEGVKDDDPVVKNVQASVVRTIAEFEVARLQAEESVPTAELPPKPPEDDDKPAISAVA